MRAVITVMGRDKIGIIYHVTKVLYEAQANIIELDQTVMQADIFSMVLLVDCSNMCCDFNELKDALEKCGKEIEMNIRIQHEDIFDSMYNI